MYLMDYETTVTAPSDTLLIMKSTERLKIFSKAVMKYIRKRRRGSGNIFIDVSNLRQMRTNTPGMEKVTEKSRYRLFGENHTAAGSDQ